MMGVEYVMERIGFPVKRAVFLVLSMMLLATLACEFDFSTANLANVRLASDEAGNNRTTIFAPDDTVYVVLDLRNAPATTSLQAVWYVVEESGDTELYRSETLESSDAKVYFNLSIDGGFSVGRYKVVLLLDGEREKTLEFEIAAP